MPSRGIYKPRPFAVVFLRLKPRYQVMSLRPCLWESSRSRVQLWWDRTWQTFEVSI